MSLPSFSIVTPSLNAREWIPLCAASVADQAGVRVEHIVQDGGSTDGTTDWLQRQPGIRVFTEQDEGMYDAVNRGFRRATGDVFAYLNCDEQYLPGALTAVGEFFASHPDVDVVVSDVVVADGEGRFLCHRKALVPTRYHTLLGNSLSFFTCAAFARRRVFQDRGLFFDPRWKDLGDAEWALRLITSGVRMAVLPRFTSVFTDWGRNRGLLPNAKQEQRILRAQAPGWARALRPVFQAAYWTRKALRSGYSQPGFIFSIYTRHNPGQRGIFRVEKPAFVWKNRKQG